MRICGTPIAFASAYCERCSSFKKSSRRTSPGCAGGKSAIAQVPSMIVDDLDIVGVAVAPAEADAPLVIDPNAVLPFAISGQPLQPISRRRPQVLEIASIVKLHQLAISRPYDVVGNPF